MREGILICFALLAVFNLSIAQESPTDGGAQDGVMIVNSTAKLGIVCHNEYIEVTLESKNYPGLEANATHLQDEACVPGYRDKTKVVFRFGLEDCKTKHEVGKEEIHYKNTIFAVVKDVGTDKVITRSSRRELPFQCSYAKKAFISKVNVSPQFTRVITDAEDYGNFTYTVHVYTNKDYSNKVEEFPFVVGIDQRLYIETRVQSGDSGLLLFPDECKATPSKDVNAKPEHVIIDQACPRDKTLEYEYKMSDVQRFSLIAFRFKFAYTDVYIHCKLTVCGSNEPDTRCAKGCQDDKNDSRKKREIKEDYSADLFVGPIKIRKEEQDKDINSRQDQTTKDSDSHMLLLVGLLVGVLGVVTLGLLAAVIIFIKKRRSVTKANTLLIRDE